MPPILLVVCAYLLGGIPWAWLIVKLALRQDVREHGSGNVGATNAARLFGPKLRLPMFAVIFLLDAGKGYIAAGVLPAAIGMNYEPWPAVAAFCAVVGHCATPFLRTLGGKGVATTIGALLALQPLATLISMGGFLVVYGFTKIVSISSITLAVILPVAAFVLGAPASVLCLTTLLSTLIVLRHRSNIQRLFRGTEN